MWNYFANFRPGEIITFSKDSCTMKGIPIRHVCCNMWCGLVCWTCLLQCVLWGFLLGMCIAMCGIGFPVGYVSCNVLCGASCRPEICKKQFSFHLELIILWIPGRRILTIIQQQFFAACLLQCVVYVKALGKALRALGKLWLWESSWSFPRAPKASPELLELSQSSQSFPQSFHIHHTLQQTCGKELLLNCC